MSKVLVIAPLKPAKETWPPEVKKWDHLKHLKLSLILGSKAERIAACEREANIYIVNRENVVWLVDYFKKQVAFRYYNKNGELAFRVFPGYEIMPFWADAAHTELDSALRLYPVEVYYGTEKKNR